MTLLDSNLFIYAILPAHAALRTVIAGCNPAASLISRVEVLGFHRLTAQEETDLEALLNLCALLPVTRDVIDRATALRQQRKMGLGDALIAATALVYGLPLATHNTADFAWVPGLTLLDPLAP